MTSSPGKNPMGALALICTVIWTPKLPLHTFIPTPTTFLQVECTLLMHSTGYYIKDERPFSEKFWGHRTMIYIKLVKELPDLRWDGLYSALAYTEGVHKKMSEFSKPVEHWTNDPDEYFIVGSDPVGEE